MIDDEQSVSNNMNGMVKITTENRQALPIQLQLKSPIYTSFLASIEKSYNRTPKSNQSYRSS